MNFRREQKPDSRCVLEINEIIGLDCPHEYFYYLDKIIRLSGMNIGMSEKQKQNKKLGYLIDMSSNYEHK